MGLRLFPAPASGEGARPAARGLEIPARPGDNLARAIWLSGAVPPRPLCLGLSRCGRCRVRYRRDAPVPLPEEGAVFSPEELAEGWRLSCRHRVPPEGGAGEPPELEVPPEACAPAGASVSAPPVASPDVASSDAGPVVLGVDLGTTSIQWRAVALPSREDGGGARAARVLAEGGLLNPQAGAGADVVSRLAFARRGDGLAALGELARAAVRRIAADLGRGGLSPARICVAANTAMTDIFLGRDVTGLCAAPYRRSHPGGRLTELPGLAPVLIPPLPAPFVGGDLSAGLAAMLAAGMPRPFVLADLGTNGELALLTEGERLFLASVPLGPALEGIGPECGRMAAPGVVTEFRLGPGGAEPVLFAGPGRGSAPGGAGAEGISATGYLSLLALLRRLGLLDAAGHFAEADALALPLARALGRGLEPSPTGARLRLPLGLWLSAGDVELLLKVKAAFAVALEAVCAAGGVAPTAVRRLALAGALGAHARPGDLKELGFAPGVPEERIVAVGNAALEGACLLAACPERLEPLAALCDRAVVLELTEDPAFQQAYLGHMRLGE